MFKTTTFLSLIATTLMGPFIGCCQMYLLTIPCPDSVTILSSARPTHRQCCGGEPVANEKHQQPSNSSKKCPICESRKYPRIISEKIEVSAQDSQSESLIPFELAYSTELSLPSRLDREESFPPEIAERLIDHFHRLRC